jgi:hypothetical protein
MRRGRLSFGCTFHGGLGLVKYFALLTLFSSNANAIDPASCPAARGALGQVRALDAQFNRTKDCALIPRIMAASDRHFALGAANCPGDWVRSKSHAQVENELRARCRHIETAQSHRESPKQQSAAQLPPPSVVVKQAPAELPIGAVNQQQSGSCSDITGTSGSGSSNCTSSNGAPPNVQAQINQAQSYMQAAKTVKESDTSYNGWSAAAAQYRKAETAFRAAGDLADAAAATEQAQTLENALKIANQQSGPSSAQPSSSAAGSCSPLAPAGPWQGSNAAYCANANCVERGSAYYGALCFPPNQPPPLNASKNGSGASQPLTSDQQARAGKAWTIIQDASKNTSPSQRRAAVGAAIAQLLQKDAELLNLIPDFLNCPADPASDQQVRFFKCINEQMPGIEEGDTSQPPPPPVSKPQATATQDQPTPMVTIDPKNKWCQIDYGAAPGSSIQICWLEASNGYCMKWRETPDGKKLPSDFDPADQQSFSNNVANAGLYTQHCPREADDKWILYWTPKKDR